MTKDNYCNVHNQDFILTENGDFCCVKCKEELESMLGLRPFKVKMP